MDIVINLEQAMNKKIHLNFIGQIAWLRRLKPIYSIVVALGISSSVLAGDFSSLAVPTRIEVVNAGKAGFMIYGEFGNAAGCTATNRIFVKSGNPQYNQLYATALTAFAAGKRLQAYVVCDSVPWYSVESITYNVVEVSYGLYISN